MALAAGWLAGWLARPLPTAPWIGVCLRARSAMPRGGPCQHPKLKIGVQLLFPGQPAAAGLTGLTRLTGQLQPAPAHGPLQLQARPASQAALSYVYCTLFNTNSFSLPDACSYTPSHSDALTLTLS